MQKRRLKGDPFLKRALFLPLTELLDSQAISRCLNPETLTSLGTSYAFFSTAAEGVYILLKSPET
jgi:hypothetical protein